MSPRRRLIILALAILGVLCWLLLHNSSPRYHGQPLTYWLQGYDARGFAEPGRDAASEAVRELGTNCIPTLLRLLRKHQSPLELKLVALRQRRRIRPPPTPASDIANHEAASSFEILGPKASNAVPDLIQILRDQPLTSSSQYTMRALGSIGPDAEEAVPALLAFVTVQTSRANYDDPRLAVAAINALACIHSRPGLVVPVLIHCLGDARTDVRYHATFALGSYGTNAQAAIPALVRMLVSGGLLSTDIQDNLVKIAGEIGMPQVIAQFTEYLHDPDPRVRADVLGALAWFGPSARPAAPDIIAALQDPDFCVRSAAEFALARVDPESLKRLNPEAAQRLGIQ